MIATETPPPGWRPPKRSVSLYPSDVGLPPLTRAQIRTLVHPAPNKLLVGGNNSGKKTVGAYWALLQSAHPANRGRTVGVLAPTGTDVESTHRDLFERMNDEFFARHGYSMFLREDKALGSYHTLWGSRILRCSYRQNPKRLANFEFAAAWIFGSDVDYMPQQTIAEISSRVKGGGTRAILWTTRPSGEQGVVRHFLAQQRSDDLDIAAQYATFRSPSWENPATSKEDLARWRQTLSEPEWQSYICTNILASTKLVWPEFRRERHITDWWPDAPKAQPWIMALDWGQTHAHITAAWVRPDAGEQLIVAMEWHGMDVTDETVVMRALDMCHEMGSWPQRIFADGAPNAKSANILLSEAMGTAAPIKRMTAGDKSIWLGVRLVRSAMAPPAGKAPALLLHQRVCGRDASPYGTLAAIEGTNRATIGEDLVDKVAENHKIEHAFDCLRYLCSGIWGLRGSKVYGSELAE